MALARFGDRCPPIVVTSGWPNSAAVMLLQKLAAAGTRLYYHGDFDGEGLRIAAAVVARTTATPWHLTSADYLSAVSQGPTVGRVSEVPWDTGLAGHLARVGVTVAEAGRRHQGPGEPGTTRPRPSLRLHRPERSAARSSGQRGAQPD